MKLIFFLCILGGPTLYAQAGKVTRLFKKGDRFMVETASNTSSVYGRGDHVLEIGTRIRTTQLFTIAAATEEGYTVVVTTAELVDTVDAPGMETVYHSASMKDTLSVVEKAIKRVIGTTDTIRINKTGTVLSAHPDTAGFFTNAVLPFTGIHPAQFAEGAAIAPFADFPVVSTEKGATWTHTNDIQNAKTVFNCTVLSTTGNNTTVTFTSKTAGTYENTNTNGVTFVDNSNGIVPERRTQHVKLENKILNGLLFSIESKSAVSQYCTFLPVQE